MTTTNETDLLHTLIARAPSALPNVRVFRRNVLNVATAHGFRARNGIPGMADAYALVVGGLHVEIETKSARGQLRGAQENWAEFCHGWGVPHVVLRAQRGEPPDRTVARWIAELSDVVSRREQS